MQVLERHARERGFSIHIEAKDDLQPIRYEWDGLLQVLINLVDNGIKLNRYADATEVVIKACPKEISVVLRVRDYGPGVPARQLGGIFEPFDRGERELTRRTKGKGTGLVLVVGSSNAWGPTSAPEISLRAGSRSRSPWPPPALDGRVPPPLGEARGWEDPWI